MGPVSTRTLSDGTLRYRAEICINRREYPVYKESKTFSIEKLAEKWLKKRALDIEINPNILYSKYVNTPLTLSHTVMLPKNLHQIEHSRHRSVYNFMVNIMAAVIAYCLNPNKPTFRNMLKN